MALSNKMVAVVLHGRDDVRVEEVPLPPKPGRFEVLCRVRAISICGTDPKIISGVFYPMWPPEYPFIIGHEWAGEIVEVGEGVEPDFKVGDRVCAEPHKGCGICRMCMLGRYTICENYGRLEKGHRHYGFTAPGGYAEYITTSTKSIHKLPPNISYDEGALVDATAVALHGCKRGKVGAGDTIAILGPGPVGLSALQCSSALGAARMIMIGRQPRLQAANEFGATDLVDFEKVDPVEKTKELTSGMGVDVAIECAGKVDAVKWALDCVRKGGRVVLIGLTGRAVVPIITDRLVLDDLEIHGIRADPNTCEEMIPLIAAGRINLKSLITHTFPLKEFNKALETFTKRIGECIKVVLHP